MNTSTESSNPQTPFPSKPLDYALNGPQGKWAIEHGLAEADWYRTPVARSQLRQLMARTDGPALRDTALWIGLLCITGWASISLSTTWWLIPSYALYAVLYATASDSRWHETSHGTAFKTDWMNDALYEISSFMVMRESVIWRWSHNRHHSDTIIVGRDPEIQVPRPPNMWSHLASVFNIGNYQSYFPGLINHAMGRMTAAECSFVPDTEFQKVFRNARMVLGLNLAIVASALYLHSWAPIFLFILPHFFGTWLMIVHNTTQHAGLAENVLDHRLNCRTVYMNPFSRFIYWNMNYHLEHHMYPLVPYHALAKLHVLIKKDCPPPYPSIFSAWRELLPAVLAQVKNPNHYVQRTLPATKALETELIPMLKATAAADGWIAVGPAVHLKTNEVMRFDHDKKTYALVRNENGQFFAMDGICTHGNTHLVDGLIKDGMIECPKHNGRFHLLDGSPARAPICRGLSTYRLEERSGCLFLHPSRMGGLGQDQKQTWTFRVVSNQNVATFIKELVLEPTGTTSSMQFKPGDYLQFDIPAYEFNRFSKFDIPSRYRNAWEHLKAFDLVSRNTDSGRRNNYSLACNQATDKFLRFNIRIALPPEGHESSPGVGSSYLFSLKPGDTLTAIGPYGDFHIKPTQREMVYIGGGAGMAPMRAHLSHLFETEKTARKVSFWYGARTLQDVFYVNYFKHLATINSNFSFHLALSEVHPSDEWHGLQGPIHQVVMQHYLQQHVNPKAIEYYLCGPPAMVDACYRMLESMGVPSHQIASDGF